MPGAPSCTHQDHHQDRTVPPKPTRVKAAHDKTVPGLRETSCDRYIPARVTGKLGAATSQLYLPSTAGSSEENSVSGILSDKDTRSNIPNGNHTKLEVVDTSSKRDKTTNRESFRQIESKTKTNGKAMKPPGNLADRRNINNIIIVDEPTEARKKKHKQKANTIAQVTQEPSENDMALESFDEDL